MQFSLLLSRRFIARTIQIWSVQYKSGAATFGIRCWMSICLWSPDFDIGQFVEWMVEWMCTGLWYFVAPKMEIFKYCALYCTNSFDSFDYIFFSFKMSATFFVHIFAVISALSFMCKVTFSSSLGQNVTLQGGSRDLV